MTIPDVDSYRCANVLLKELGEKEAWSHATRRALDLHLVDDLDGRDWWQRVLSALHNLTRGKAAGERVQ